MVFDNQVPLIPVPVMDENTVGSIGTSDDQLPVFAAVSVTSWNPCRPMLYSVAMSAWTAILFFG